jgi:hypothetical protein
MASHIYARQRLLKPGRDEDGTQPARRASSCQVDARAAVGMEVAAHVRDLMALPAMSVRAAATGQFWGQHMTKGDIYTIAGNGTPGSTGDGGLARQAPVSLASVTIDSAGNLILGPADPAAPVRVIAASPNLFYGVRMLPWHIYGLGTAS